MLKKYNFSYLSSERSAIMGFSILWIVFFHSTVSLHGLFYIIKSFGNLGVELFLILSGIGLYYSMQKLDGNDAKQRVVYSS